MSPLQICIYTRRGILLPTKYTSSTADVKLTCTKKGRKIQPIEHLYYNFAQIDSCSKFLFLTFRSGDGRSSPCICWGIHPGSLDPEFDAYVKILSRAFNGNFDTQVVPSRMYIHLRIVRSDRWFVQSTETFTFRNQPNSVESGWQRGCVGVNFTCIRSEIRGHEVIRW